MRGQRVDRQLRPEMNPRTRAWLLSDEGAKTRQWGKE